ncbi:MAG: ribosome biogenesis GTPase Der [Candidatus Aminicenantes bacterium]|nr:ribosome biogenesis GTPase Der [Candidatus Aminicenantes bacterium]
MADLPQIAIVGFPNVGKSTLFNKLARRRVSLVHSLPGMTRDRVSAAVRLLDREVELIDTGGFIDELAGAEPLAAQVHKMAWEAARRADVLLFLVDGRRGLLPVERGLFQSLKKLDKPLVVAVNKIDTDRPGPEAAEFYRLGEKTLHFISAEHSVNLDALAEALVDLLPGAGAEDAVTADKPLRIAVIGRTNVGKSSLTNRLCGEERLIVSELPGTTRDSVDVLIRRGDKAYRLVDTAGIRKLSKTGDERESAGVIKSRKNIDQADVLCLLLDALEFPTRQDAAVAQMAKESGKPLIVAVNKWDLVRDEMMKAGELENLVFARLEFIRYAPVLTVSALTGKRVLRILDLAESVWRAGGRTIGTADLNRFLDGVHRNNSPMTPSGRRFRIKYMTQAGVLPPSFRLYAGRNATFAPASAKHFENRLREAFGFEGNPIRIYFRGA